jgi:hypothetical protein
MKNKQLLTLLMMSVNAFVFGMDFDALNTKKIFIPTENSSSSFYYKNNDNSMGSPTSVIHFMSKAATSSKNKSMNKKVKSDKFVELDEISPSVLRNFSKIDDESDYGFKHEIEEVIYMFCPRKLTKEEIEKQQ